MAPPPRHPEVGIAVPGSANTTSIPASEALLAALAHVAPAQQLTHAFASFQAEVSGCNSIGGPTESSPGSPADLRLMHTPTAHVRHRVWVTTAEACAALGLSHETLRQLRLRGVLTPGKHYPRWGCTQGRAAPVAPGER